jgi:hypothetical protein
MALRLRDWLVADVLDGFDGHVLREGEDLHFQALDEEGDHVLATDASLGRV